MTYIKFYCFCFFLLFFPITNYVVVNFALSLVLLVMLVIRILRDKNSFSEFSSNHTLFMTVWFLWTALSFFWSLDTMQWLLQSMVVFIALTHSLYLQELWRDRKHTVLLTFILANIIHNIIGWVQIVLLGGRIPESLFYNQNFLATYLLFSLIILVFWETNRFQLRSPLKYFLLLSNLLLIVFANSRGITVITLLTLVLIFYFKMYSQEFKKLFIGIALFSLIAGLFVLIFTDIVHAVVNDSSTIIRANLVLSGLRYLLERPIIGLGAGSVTYLIEHYPLLYTNQLTVLHNWWIGLLVTHGVIFFTVYMIRYLWNGYLVARMALRTKNPRAQRIVVFFLAMIIAVMIPDSLFHSIWFWIIMNMIWTEIEQLKEEDSTIQTSWVRKLNVRYHLNSK